MNVTATLTSKGQVTIPQAIREALGLDTGARLSFELDKGELRVRPLRTKAWADLWACAEKAPKPGKAVDVDAAILAVVRKRATR
jgi:AbrB family looped-hinge helix DNA binding protein